MKQIPFDAPLEVDKAYLIYSCGKLDDGDVDDVVLQYEKRIVLFLVKPTKLLQRMEDNVKGIFDLMTQEDSGEAITINDAIAVKDYFDVYDVDDTVERLLFELNDEEFAKHVIAEFV